jgi:integrase
MEFVHPIKEKKKLKDIKTFLMGKNLRDYCLFTLGIHSGLRISDLLKLKLNDVIDKKGKPKDRITLREKKTNKSKNFPLSAPARKAITEYLSSRENYKISEPLFISRKGESSINRMQAYRIINNAARAVGINDIKIGTHTMRKTFGYHAYKAGVSITLLMKLFNHSAPSISMAYLGLTQEDEDEVYLGMDLYK